jgi:hypothetical protein
MKLDEVAFIVGEIEASIEYFSLAGYEAIDGG